MTKINADGIGAQWALQEAQLPQNNDLNKQLKSEAELEKASGGFEALLLHNMLKEMWGSTSSGGILEENSNEMNIFRDMFNQAIAEEVVKGEGIGVKKFLKKELSKSQDGASKSLGKV